MKTLALALTLLLAAAAPAAAEEARPFTLQAAIERALVAHPDVLQADVDARNAALGVADAQSQRVQLVAELSSLGRYAQSGLLDPQQTPSAGTQLGTANANLELRVPLFTGFKITNAIKAAEYRKAAAGFGLTESVAKLRFEVTRAFWNLRREERLEAEQAVAITQSEHVLALARARRAQGTATALDVDRAEVDLLSARGDLLATGSKSREARATLASWLGVPAQEVVIAERPEDADAVPVTPAVHARVSAEEARLAAASASVAAAEGDRWPQLGLVTAYQHGNNPYNPNSGVRGVNTSLSGTFDVRLGVSYNVFDLGTVNRAIARAENDKQLAATNVDRVRREVATQATLAESALATSKERLNVAEAGATLAERALKFAETRWVQGYASQVDVIDAQRALLRARTQRVEARYDLAIAAAELNWARSQ